MRIICILSLALLIASCLVTTGCKAAPQPQSATTLPADKELTDAEFSAALEAVVEMAFAPPPDAVEVAPGVWAVAWAAEGEERPLALALPTTRPTTLVLQRSAEPVYGVRVRFFRKGKSAQPTLIRYREILTNPAPTEVWPENSDFDDLPADIRPSVEISQDRTTCTLSQTVQLQPGALVPTFTDPASGDTAWLSFPGPWVTAKSDPIGKYRIQAFLNEKKLLDCDISVVE